MTRNRQIFNVASYAYPTHVHVSTHFSIIVVSVTHLVSLFLPHLLYLRLTSSESQHLSSSQVHSPPQSRLHHQCHSVFTKLQHRHPFTSPTLIVLHTLALFFPHRSCFSPQIIAVLTKVLCNFPFSRYRPLLPAQFLTQLLKRLQPTGSLAVTALKLL